jgi:Arc/MetJ-type ribon-helix-helix transcriptional regulator
MPLAATKKTKSLGELLKKAKSEAPAKPRKAQFQQPPLTFTTVSLTPASRDILDRLSREATKQTGRRVSASSVIRALLQVAEEQGLADQVVTVIETEMNTGTVVWGRVRQE